MSHQRPFLGEDMTPRRWRGVATFVGGIIAALVFIPILPLLWLWHTFAHLLGLPCPF